MASGYAPQMEKIAGMHPSEQREFCDNLEVVADTTSVKPPSTTVKYDCNSNVTMNTMPSTTENDVEQLRGPAEMENLAVISTKNWLITAYAA
jgi:hypothetical protein